MLRTVNVVAYCLLFIYSNAQRHQTFDLKKIDAYVQQLMDEWKIAGCAIGIVYKDSLIFSKGYGYRNVKDKLPVTPKTLFILGSNTKFFTAIAACMLHVEKKLDLDKPVRAYMPELQLANKELNEKLTIRDVLSHRSGIPRWDGFWFNASYDTSKFLEKLKYLSPTHPFRETFLYNNNYYTTAGLVSGKMYGSNWEELIKKRIFSLLGMNESCFNISKADPDVEVGCDYITDAQTNTWQQLYNASTTCTCIEPSGLIVSNVEELSHWVIALLNKGAYKKSQVIQAAAIDEALRVNNFGFGRYRYQEVLDRGYGLGINIASYKGHDFLFHGGTAGGYRSEISFFPKDSIGIIVLTNTVQGSGMAAAAVVGIIDRVLNLGELPWSQRLMSEQRLQISSRKKELDSLRSIQTKNTSPSHPLHDYTGVYENKIYDTVTITIKGNTLHFHFRNVDSPMEHFQYDQFWTKELPNYSVYPQLYPVYRLNFFTDNKGKIFKFQTSIIGDPETEFMKVTN